ncbi:MAG: hypothetical protein FJ270_05675 [Planctomycetes bacterium]|nr:hypothetical protein [Planctomycetota bacterium]
MKRHLALIVLLVAGCSDDPTPPLPTPASVPGTSTPTTTSGRDNAETSDIAMGGTTADGTPTNGESGARTDGAAGGATMRRDPNAAPSSTVVEPEPAQTPSNDAPSSDGGAAGSSGPSAGGQTEDPATAALRARTREARWNDFRAIVQKQADLMVKVGLARKKMRQDPTPENRAAYDRIWGGIAPLAARVTEYMAQTRFSDEDRAVMSMIVDEIQSKAMATVEAAP